MMKIEELDFSARTYNCLKRAKVDTVDQLSRMSDEDLMRLRCFGQKCLDEVRAKIPLPRKTNGDRIRDMSDEELADFFFESPEIEFEVCEYCEYFGGHTSDTPCKHDLGMCLITAKNEAFRKWLQQPAEPKEVAK